MPNRETVSFKNSIILGCRVHQEVGIKQTTEISDAPLSRKFAKLRAMTTSSPETSTLTQAIKRVLPKTLFGRALAIIVTPLILMQAISTFVFYDRHWDVMTRRLVYSLSGDIALVVEQLGQMPDAETLVNATRGARRHLDGVRQRAFGCRKEDGGWRCERALAAGAKGRKGTQGDAKGRKGTRAVGRQAGARTVWLLSHL